MTSGGVVGMRGKVSLLPTVPGTHLSLRAAYLFCKGPAPPSMVSASKTTYRSLTSEFPGKILGARFLTNLLSLRRVMQSQF